MRSRTDVTGKSITKQNLSLTEVNKLRDVVQADANDEAVRLFYDPANRPTRWKFGYYEAAFYPAGAETSEGRPMANVLLDTNTKTINGESIFGNGDITLSGGGDIKLTKYQFPLGADGD